MSKDKEPKPSRRRRPATSPEARENRLISLAVDLTEQQLMDGTASPSVITHFLKLATERDRLERVKIERETELLNAKVDAINQSKEIQKLYENAIAAFRGYAGQEEEEPYEDED